MKNIQKTLHYNTRASKKFCNILVHANLQHIYPICYAVQAVEGICWVSCIMVIGVLTHCTLFHCVWFESHTDEYATLSNLETYIFCV